MKSNWTDSTMKLFGAQSVRLFSTMGFLGPFFVHNTYFLYFSSTMANFSRLCTSHSVCTVSGKITPSVNVSVFLYLAGVLCLATIKGVVPASLCAQLMQQSLTIFECDAVCEYQVWRYRPEQEWTYNWSYAWQLCSLGGRAEWWLAIFFGDVGFA